MSKLTAEQRAALSAAASILGKIKSPAKTAARKKNMAKARESRWPKDR